MKRTEIEACSEVSNNPVVVVSECGRRFEIRNPNRETINKVKVDGCLIDDHRERCDYLFEIGSACYCAVYVELKGSDIDKAFNQLIATLGYLSQHHRTCVKVCHIVASRVPRAGTKVQTMKTLMARKHRVQLIVGTTQTVIDVSCTPYCE